MMEHHILKKTHHTIDTNINSNKYSYNLQHIIYNDNNKPRDQNIMYIKHGNMKPVAFKSFVQQLYTD